MELQINAPQEGWNKKNKKLLADLWRSGVDTAQIGRTLGGFSKNAVIGQAHRLGLSSHKKACTSKRRTPDLPLFSEKSGCLWPLGNPGEKDFHFCGAEMLPGKPYCAAHAAKAYVGFGKRDPGVS